jgi:hypothetical protein
MATDLWIPRILAIGQLVLLAVCGSLIALGHDSVITDLFIAAGGSLVGSSVISKVKSSKGLPYQSSEDAQ